MKRLIISAVAGALLLAACGGGHAAKDTASSSTTAKNTGATTTTVSLSSLKSELLSISQMPTGWSVDNSNSGAPKGCDHDALVGIVSPKYVGRDFAANGGLPALQEEIVPADGVAFIKVKKALDTCKRYSEPLGNKKVEFTQGEMSFPRVGDASAAWNVSVTVQGVNVVGDIVVAQKDQNFVEVAYLDIGSVDLGQFHHFVSEALAKVH